MILNVTQHLATPSQIADGVVEPEESYKSEIRTLLTFNENWETLKVYQLQRAESIAIIVKKHHCDKAMIGGALFFMPTLVEVLRTYGITPLFSFSKREVIEKVSDDKVIKESVFTHTGWVYP